MGAPLDDAQKALVTRHDALVAENNALADSEHNPLKRVGQPPRTERFIDAEVLRISKLPPFEQVHASRAEIHRIRSDPKHPFNDLSNRGAHENAVENMKMLYAAQYFEDLNTPILPDE